MNLQIDFFEAQSNAEVLKPVLLLKLVLCLLY
jgi:hypothetical protein